MAKEVSRLGTCRRLKVGCILLGKDGKVVGVGYNGAGPGMPHCHPDTCGPEHRCLRCVHSECNALANRAGAPYTAYLTHSPCLNCLREMVLAGVRRVVYRKAYTSMPEDEKRAQNEWVDHYGVEMVCNTEEVPK